MIKQKATQAYTSGETSGRVAAYARVDGSSQKHINVCADERSVAV